MSESRPTTSRSEDAGRLPSGRVLDLHRSRWEGVLDAEELRHCRAQGIELAYDCAQIGWVPAGCVDEPETGGGERTVDLTSFRSPEQDARRLLDTLASQLERVRADLPNAAAAADAIARLRASLAPQIADHRARHGVAAASRCHLVTAARLAAADAPSRAAAQVASEFTFRHWTPADAERYRAMLDNPRLWHYLPERAPLPLTAATALALIEVGRIDARQEAVAVVRDGEPIGQCLLRLHEPFAGMRTAEVAYWLAEEHWGKGWMSRILPTFVLRCFVHHEVEALEAWIHADHAASARVAERSGFVRDTFAFEAELAVALAKPRGQRYVAYRGAYAALRPAPGPSVEAAGGR